MCVYPMQILYIYIYIYIYIYRNTSFFLTYSFLGFYYLNPIFLRSLLCEG